LTGGMSMTHGQMDIDFEMLALFLMIVIFMTQSPWRAARAGTDSVNPTIRPAR
jgi:hypothetical protein